MPMKSKEEYRETYREGWMTVRQDLLPERLPFMTNGWRVVGMEVRAAGRMSDGREFHDVRVYCREVAEPVTGAVPTVETIDAKG